jgi:hypothetical protein
MGDGSGAPLHESDLLPAAEPTRAGCQEGVPLRPRSCYQHSQVAVAGVSFLLAINTPKDRQFESLSSLTSLSALPGAGSWSLFPLSY